MTVLQVLARIKELSIDLAKAKNIDIDAEVVSEILLARCIQIVVNDMLEEPEGVLAFLTNITLTFAGGATSLPLGLKEEYCYALTFLNDIEASWCQNYRTYVEDLVGGLFPLDVGRFTAYGGNLLYSAKGTSITDATGDYDLLAPILPTFNTLNISDNILIRDDILQRIINFTVAVVLGDIRISALGIDAIEHEDEE